MAIEKDLFLIKDNAESYITKLTLNLEDNLKKSKSLFKELRKNLKSREKELASAINANFKGEIDSTKKYIERYLGQLGRIGDFKGYMELFVRNSEIEILSSTGYRDELIKESCCGCEEFLIRNPTIEVSAVDEAKKFLAKLSGGDGGAKSKVSKQSSGKYGKSSGGGSGKMPPSYVQNLNTNAQINSQFTMSKKDSAGVVGGDRNPDGSTKSKASDNAMIPVGRPKFCTGGVSKRDSSYDQSDHGAAIGKKKIPSNNFNMTGNFGCAPLQQKASITSKHSERLTESRDLKKLNKQNNIGGSLGAKTYDTAKQIKNYNAGYSSNQNLNNGQSQNLLKVNSYEPGRFGSSARLDTQFEINYLDCEKVSICATTNTNVRDTDIKSEKNFETPRLEDVSQKSIGDKKSVKPKKSKKAENAWDKNPIASKPPSRKSKVGTKNTKDGIAKTETKSPPRAKNYKDFAVKTHSQNSKDDTNKPRKSASTGVFNVELDLTNSPMRNQTNISAIPGQHMA